jgi:outer membrane protein assembly factor BamB
VLAGAYDSGISGDHAIALDLATGRVRWHSGLAPNGVLPGSGQVLLTQILPPVNGPDGRDPAQAPAELRAVSLRDGTEQWSYRMEPGCQHGAVTQDAAAVPGVAVLCSDGELRLLDPATGRVQRSTILPADNGLSGVRLPDGTLPWNIGPILEMVGRQVLLGYDRGAGLTLIAYDATTLRVEWTDQLSGELLGVDGCGVALCVSGTTGLTVLDRSTGAIRWRRDDRVLAQVVSGAVGSLVSAGAPIQGELVALDSGRPLLNLGGWTPAGPPRLPPMFLLWDEETGRTWFGVLNAASTMLRPLGFAADALDNACGWSGRYLVCQTFDRGLRIWRYRG